jgi:hypothetical protein
MQSETYRLKTLTWHEDNMHIFLQDQQITYILIVHNHLIISIKFLLFSGRGYKKKQQQNK